MPTYSVRFERGNRGWTCSVFAVDDTGTRAERSVASGTGNTQQAAKDDALSLAFDAGIRAALTSADPRRPYWVQGAAGERREAERKAAAGSSERRPRTQRSPSAR
jgi:hypothetical protein